MSQLTLKDGENRKYRYVVAYDNIRSGAYKTAFSGLNSGKESRFVQFMPKSEVGRFIHLFAYTERLRFPYQHKLAEYISKKEGKYLLSVFEQIEGDKPPCLITNQLFEKSARHGVIEYLKSRYPDLKVVYYFTDLVKEDLRRGRILKDPEAYYADLILTYDDGDAEKYGLDSCHLPSDLETGDGGSPKYDVCFIGRAKHRYPDILKVYDHLTQKGLSCKFIVVTEKVKLTEFREGIQYRKHVISYEEYLNIEKESRCLLEIVQEDSCGYTTRVPEAVFLSKKLITNNQAMLSDENYDPKNILVFQKAEDIDVEFIRDTEPAVYKEDFREVFDPQRFLQLVDDKLNEKFS